MPAAKKTPAAKTTGTALATKKNANLVDIKAQMAAQIAALADRTAPPTGASVKVTQDKKFKFPDGTESPGPFEAVIVDFITTRKYYPGAYDPNNIVPPACFAISTGTRGMNPSPNSPELQNPPEKGGCDKCPNNQWGTATTGQGKACKETRKLAIMPPAEEGEDVSQTPIWTLEVSPTGIKPFDGYVNSVAKTFGVMPVGVVTQFSFDPNVTYASVRVGNPEPNPDLGDHSARAAEAIEILSAEPDVSNYGQEAPAAPARGRAAPARKQVARR